MSLPDLAPFSALAATPLAGAADLKLTATGAAKRPELDLALDRHRDCRRRALAVGHLDRHFRRDFDTALGEGRSAFEPMGQRPTEGLALDGRTLADGRLALSTRGRAAGPRARRSSASCRVRSSLGEISGHARIDRDRLAGTARLDARVPELKAVMLALDGGLPLAGTVALGADVVLAKGRSGSRSLSMAPPPSLSGLPPGAQELVGATPTLQAEAVVEPDREAVVPEPRARWRRRPPRRSAALRLRGRYARRRAAPRHSRPCPPRAAVGQPIAGAADLRAGLSRHAWASRRSRWTGRSTASRSRDRRSTG